MSNTPKYSTGRASRVYVIITYKKVKRISTSRQLGIAHACIYKSVIHIYKN